MNLQATDYLLTRFAHALPAAMKLLGDIETDLLGGRVAAIPIDRPVFINGLARSGTTLLLNLFAQLPQVATHRYSDFPFLFVPFAWNRLQHLIGNRSPPVERPHRDRIMITKDSPEAFEEPIWTHFFPAIHDPRALHRLTAADRQPLFDTFFTQHLRKVLLLRGGTRYVSKSNYNVTRIEYLADLLPDARFVVPVRHPVAHVESLMRQHKIFSDYNVRDGRVAEYMRAAGHFEFGPQRVPVNIDLQNTRQIADAWSSGQDDLGYSVMWRSIYSHICTLKRTGSHLGGRIEIIRYEDLCQHTDSALRQLAQFCELEEGVDTMLARRPKMSPREPDAFQLTRKQRGTIWGATAETAESFGYGSEQPAR